MASGFDNTEDAIRWLQEQTEQKMKEAVLIVQSEAKNRARRDSGQLVNSIQERVTKDSSRVRGFVGTNAEHAIFNEKGTGEFAENGLGRKGGWVYRAPNGEIRFTYGLRPQPFLEPAFENNQDKIKKLFSKLG